MPYSPCTDYHCRFQLRHRIGTAVLKVLNTQQDAWNRGDIDGFMQATGNPTHWYLWQQSSGYGWKTTLDHYKSFLSD